MKLRRLLFGLAATETAIVYVFASVAVFSGTVTDTVTALSDPSPDEGLSVRPSADAVQAMLALTVNERVSPSAFAERVSGVTSSDGTTSMGS